MKKLTILATVLLGLSFFTACDSDRDSNPTYKQPTTFTLNQPAASSGNYLLEDTEYVTVTTTQPDYGYTAPVVYAAQISLSPDSWVAQTDDNEGTMRELDTKSTSAKINMPTAEIDRALVELAKYASEEATPATQTFYVRLKATVDRQESVYSNVIALTAVPYYIELKSALPNFFFLIGNCVGDGSWGNGMDKIGTATVPMALVDGASYNVKTGDGLFTFTGNFPAASENKGFKLIGLIDDVISWDSQWGNGDDGDTPGNEDLRYNDGGSGHIGFTEAGWYKINLNTETNTMTFDHLDAEPHAAYDNLGIIGTFNEWADQEPMTQVGDFTHVWTITKTFTEDAELKFRANGSWDYNWGAKSAPAAQGEDEFPYGMTGGENISVPAGTYIIIFNDIDLTYYFFAQQQS